MKRLLLILLLLCLPLKAETIVLSSFSSGELSPLVGGRVDVSKYYSGCEELENMVVLPQGGVRKRPGTRFIAEAGKGVVIEGSTGVSTTATYTLTNITENNTLWRLPLGDETIGSLNSGGDAVDVGGGIVGLPYTGHPFTIADTVRITGTTNYNGEFTLEAGTTTNELQITDTYVSESFDATEVIVSTISSLGSGAGRAVTDSSGNIYYGHNWSGGNSTYVTKITPAGVLSYNDLVGGTWPVSGNTSSTIVGMSLSDDDRYLYLMIELPFISNQAQIEKYDIIAGTLEWSVNGGFFPGFDMDIDASGNAYAAGLGQGGVFGTSALSKFASADGTQTSFNEPGANSNYVVLVDDDLGIVLMSYGTILNVRTLSDSSGETLAFPAIIASGNIVELDDVFYIRSGLILYKITIDMDGSEITGITTVTSITGPSDAVGLYIDLYDSIVVVNQDWISGQADVIHFYDTDLEPKAVISNMYASLLQTWDSLVGGSWMQGNVSFNGDIAAAGTNTSPTVIRPATELGSGISPIRLIEFEFSTIQAYVLEFGDKYMRFFKDNGLILSGEIPYAIPTPYLAEDLFELQVIQSADTMYIVHNDYAPRSLTRSAHDNWTLSTITYSRGPFLADNTTTTTITPSATTGTITLTASSAIFNEGHVGALWEVTHTIDANEIEGTFTSTGTSSTLEVQLDRSLDFTTHGIWTGTVLLQRSFDDGSTWKDVYPLSSKDDGNVTLAETETVDDALYRVNMSSYTSGTMTYNLLARSHDLRGVVTISAFTDSTVVTGTVTNTLGGIAAVTTWAEGAWSTDEGYPGAIAFYEERQAYAATIRSPQSIWFTATDDWDNMFLGTLDTSAFSRIIAADEVNAIKWMEPKTSLLVGTSGGEWELSSGTAAEPVTPTNVQIKRQSTNGSAALQAVAVGNDILYVQKQGLIIRNIAYSFERDSWISPDLTILSDHITKSGIKEIAYQRNPYHILWVVLNNGEVAGLTLEENNAVIGWHSHKFDGLVESVATIPGISEDEVWFAVKRTVQNTDRHYIEQMQPFNWGDDQKDIFFVDTGLSFDGGSDVNINSISLTNPAIVNATAHGFTDGSQVRFNDIGGMVEVDNKVFSVGTISTDSFVLRDIDDTTDVNSVNFTEYSSGGTVEVVENRFSGFGHMENESVIVAADGGHWGSTTVSNGIIELTDYYNTVHAGKAYNTKLRPMRLSSPGALGKMFSTNKRISEVVVRMEESLAVDVGVSWSEYFSGVFREIEDPLEDVIPLFSGDKRIDFDGDYETDGFIYVQSRLPLPLTVLAISAEVEVNP